MFILLLIIVTGFALLVAFRLLSGDVVLLRPPDISVVPVSGLPDPIDAPMDPEPPASLAQRLEKVERLLLEKNTLIDRLQGEVEAERSHRLEFEKVRSLLDEEIVRLKEQNRALKAQQQESRNA